jgi:hypothetical protein
VLLKRAPFRQQNIKLWFFHWIGAQGADHNPKESIMLGALLTMAGGIALVIGAIWLVVVTFQNGILWGLASLFIPFVSLIFVMGHWTESKTPFLLQVAGVVLIVIGIVMSPELVASLKTST